MIPSVPPDRPKKTAGHVVLVQAAKIRFSPRKRSLILSAPLRAPLRMHGLAVLSSSGHPSLQERDDENILTDSFSEEEDAPVNYSRSLAETDHDDLHLYHVCVPDSSADENGAKPSKMKVSRRSANAYRMEIVLLHHWLISRNEKENAQIRGVTMHGSEV